MVGVDPHPNLCHRVGRDHSSPLEVCRNVSTSAFFPPVGRKFYCYWLPLVWASFVDQISPSCDPSIHTTGYDESVTKTLLYCTHFACQGEVLGTCKHNKTTYSIYQQENQYTCFDPQSSPREVLLEVRHSQDGRNLINRTQVTNPHLPVVIFFLSFCHFLGHSCGIWRFPG